jgi:hypothetical protein
MIPIMSHQKFSILKAMIVSSLGSGALLHAADSQLPVSPFLIPPAGAKGAGNVVATTGNGPAVTPDAPSFTGFVDTTYNYNLDRPTSGYNTGYSFMQKANSFQVDNAQLEITGAPKGDQPITYMMKINFGTDATIEQSSSAPAPGVSGTGGSLDVEEAWGAYVDPVSNVGLKVGKFVTYEGIEVIEGMNDPTITRGFLFSLAEPFTTTGFLLTWKGTVFDYAAGLVNGFDQLTAANGGKDVVLKMGVSLGDPLTLCISGLYGTYQTAAGGTSIVGPGPNASLNSNKRGSFDITGLTKVIPKVQLNFQFNAGFAKNAASAVALGATNAAASGGTNTAINGQSKWVGGGIQPVYAFTASTNIGFRAEILDDLDGALTGIKQELVTLSICPATNITPHFLLRGEGRIDITNASSTTPYFFDHNGNGTKIQAVLAAEAIYNF